MHPIVLPAPVSLPLPEPLRDARAGTNHQLSHWHAPPTGSRSNASERSYRGPRECYPPLASWWAVAIADETSATLSRRARILRRRKRIGPPCREGCRIELPRHQRVKAGPHPGLCRCREGRVLGTALSVKRHLQFTLSSVRNPLFERYGEAPGWKLGPPATDRALLLPFPALDQKRMAERAAGVDVNVPPRIEPLPTSPWVQWT